LFVFFVLGVPALAQQSRETIAFPVLQGAPSLQQTLTNQRAANSLEQPWRIAPPPINNMDPSFPNPAACTNSPADSPDRQGSAEWALGKKLAADLERHATLISDRFTTDYLNRLEQAIVLHSHLQGCFVVKLVNNVETNAYSLPGGFLYVNSGLILNAENEAELVAALAHETGHITARHFTKIEAQRRVWRRLSLAGGPAGWALRWRLGRLFTLKLLRNAEFEADRLAAGYQSASGYDPSELTHLLQDVSQQEGKPASFFARLFDEHPSTDARIKRVRQAIGCHRRSQTYAVDTSQFHDVKGRVADLMRVDNLDLLRDKERLVAGPSGLRQHPGSCQSCQ
jgi:predicted Zn-dependent protease